MEKKWYKSKTVYAALCAGIIGVLQAAGIVIPEWVFTILGAFGLYALRDGVGKPLK